MVRDIELLNLSDQEILTENDPLKLSRLTALSLKRLMEHLDGCPSRCWGNYWHVRGLWAVVGVLVTVILIKVAASAF
jgi:hypothetical protein